MALLQRSEPGKLRQEVSGIVGILIIGETLERHRNDAACLAGIVSRGLANQSAHRRRDIILQIIAGIRRGRRCFAGAGCFEAGSEGGKAAGDADLPAADGGFERGARHGQDARARKGPEQHGAEHASGRVGKRGHVERHELARGFAAGGKQCRRINPAVGERDPLGHGEDAVGGRDEQRPLRRDEAAFDRACGFHQFGGEHDVDVSRHGQQAKHGLAPCDPRGCLRKQLDVIDRRAGTLRDARNRGRLREIAAMLCEIDDPVSEHAAALAAQRHNCDGDRPYLGDLGVHR